MIDQHWSLAEKFLKKGFWLYLFSFIIAPMGYIIKIIISGEISVSELWILYWIISLVTLISTYNDLWMTESLKHFIPQYVAKKNYDKVKSILFYALFTQIITSILIASIFYFWADFIANNYFKTQTAKETLKIFAFFFIGINIFQTINNFFLAVQDTLYFKITEFLRMAFIMLSVLFIFLWDIWSLYNYSLSWLIWLYAWILLVLVLFYNKYYKAFLSTANILFDKKLFVKIFKYAWLVFLWASAWTILGQMDMQMVIYMLWTTDAWYYTNYLSIIWIPFIIIGPIFAFLFPVFSELYSKKDYKKIKLMKGILTNNFLVIWIMFNIFFFIFAEIIAFTLFWEKFIQSWIILKYSILLLVFNFLLQINFNLMAWIGKVIERVKIITMAIIFNFILNVILIKFIWVSWAALATWIGWVLIFILSEFFLWKKYFMHLDWKLILRNIFLMSLLGIFFYYYLIEIFSWMWRIESFFSLAWVFLIWFWFFAITNYSSGKKFILEVKKIRK